MSRTTDPHLSIQRLKTERTQRFNAWFAELCEFSAARGNDWLIDRADPGSYREYFDDGDSIVDTYLMELMHVDEDASAEVIQ